MLNGIEGIGCAAGLPRADMEGNDGMAIADAQIDVVARLLAALGEASRIRIIRAVWDGPLSVGEIADAAGLKQSNASKQLATLVEAGVLSRQREGAIVRYEIALPMVRELCALVCDGARQIATQRYQPFA